MKGSRPRVPHSAPSTILFHAPPPLSWPLNSFHLLNAPSPSPLHPPSSPEIPGTSSDQLQHFRAPTLVSEGSGAPAQGCLGPPIPRVQLASSAPASLIPPAFALPLPLPGMLPHVPSGRLPPNDPPPWLGPGSLTGIRQEITSRSRRSPAEGTAQKDSDCVSALSPQCLT